MVVAIIYVLRTSRWWSTRSAVKISWLFFGGTFPNFKYYLLVFHVLCLVCCILWLMT